MAAVAAPKAVFLMAFIFLLQIRLKNNAPPWRFGSNKLTYPICLGATNSTCFLVSTPFLTMQLENDREFKAQKNGRQMMLPAAEFGLFARFVDYANLKALTGRL
ncbi:MAG: hypothetical protein P4M15_10565 [Alphaproteobacteria bacterium]|nr:hypothetical protein [Alphaproteobacteria bacterium]